MIFIQLYSYSHYYLVTEGSLFTLPGCDKSVQTIEGVGDYDKKRVTIGTETLVGLWMTG